MLLQPMSVRYLIMQYQHSDPGAYAGRGNLLLLNLLSIFPQLELVNSIDRRTALGVSVFFALHT